MSREKQRKRLLHVAELAGVSLSTVDRVLNERGSVSDAKRRKVLQTAKALGINRTLPSAIHGLLRVDLLMVDSRTDHFRRLGEAFARQAEMLKSRLVLQRLVWQERSPSQLLDHINAPRTPRQGLIVVGHDSPEVRQALDAQIQQGVPVVVVTTSMSGLPGATYVGVDNEAAGRSAGSLMARWMDRAGGRVLLITNSLLYEAHRQRVKGFNDALRARVPTAQISEPIECFDEDELSAEAVQAALSDEGEWVGIYSTGSGTGGIYRVLKDRPEGLVWIGHEATEAHAEMLRTGVLSLVLDQDADGQAEAAIQHLLYANGDLDVPPRIAPQMRIIIDETVRR